MNVAQGALVTGKEPARHGNAHPNIVPYRPSATADGELAVAAANDGLFARLCEALERPDLLRFATNPTRVEQRAELSAELEQGLRRARPPTNGSSGSARPGSRPARCAACSRRSPTRGRSPSSTRRSGRCRSCARRSARRRTGAAAAARRAHPRGARRARLRRRRDRGAAATVGRVTGEVERQHYNVTFTLLARRGGRLRAAAVARRAGAADDPARPGHDHRRRGLDPHRLPAERLGRDADRGPARRHVRQEARRWSSCWSCSRSARCSPALATSIGADDRRARHPGRRRRGLPALVRDHPRRVPARAIRTGSR